MTNLKQLTLTLALLFTAAAGAWADGDSTPEPGTVTINDTKTTASFTMPASDMTVNYTLVRDMQDATNPVAFSGIPTSDVTVKKGDDGKYQPVEALTIQLTDPLITDADAQNIIAADGITVTIEKKGDGNTWTALAGTTLDAFLADMQPGTYRLTATATDENSPYDGTVTSDEFTTVELYDLLVKPADEYSKNGLDKVTVGTEEITPDAQGKAAKTGIAPDTEVKLKAKRGYIIEKVEAGKTDKLKTLRIGNVFVMELVYAEGDTWKKVVERNSPKIWINEENQHILSSLGYLSWNENEEYKGDVVSTDVIDPNKEYFWNE